MKIVDIIEPPAPERTYPWIATLKDGSDDAIIVLFISEKTGICLHKPNPDKDDGLYAPVGTIEHDYNSSSDEWVSFDGKVTISN